MSDAPIGFPGLVDIAGAAKAPFDIHQGYKALNLRERELDENQRQFDKQFKDEHLMNMAAFAAQQRKMDWQKRFRDALAGR